MLGATTAIMLGSYADMTFLGFFFYQGKPGFTNGLVCVGLRIIGVIYTYTKNRDISSVIGPMKAIDF